VLPGGIGAGKISGGSVTAIYVADTNRTSHLPDDMLLFSIRELLLKEEMRLEKCGNAGQGYGRFL